MGRLGLLVALSLVVACGGDDGDGGGIDAATAGIDAMPGGNADPVASFTIVPNCTSSNTDPITFTSTSTDPDDDPITCAWVFNSGTPGSGTECTVTGITFPHQSPYGIALTVSDGNGGTHVANMQINRCP